MNISRVVHTAACATLALAFTAALPATFLDRNLK
jgi:hypothetical protein